LVESLLTWGAELGSVEKRIKYFNKDTI